MCDRPLIIFRNSAEVEVADLHGGVEAAGDLPAEVHIDDCEMVGRGIGEITPLDGLFQAVFDVRE